MKNILKISLVAACAVAAVQTNSFAGDSLAEALTNGKVKGQIKSYYFAKDYSDNATKDASIWVNGLQLGYKTGDFKGLSAGATAQFSSTTHDDDDSNKYAGTMNTSGTVMSELYLQYNIDQTAIKVGRQYFWTPVVGGSGSRFNRQSFEGYSVTTNFANTKIVGAYMTKFAERTDGAGEPGEFLSSGSRVGVDGTWTIYAKNNSVENLTLQGQYASKSEKTKGAKDGHDIMYFDATYKFAGDMKPYIAAQYLNTSYEAAGKKDGDAYGAKVGATIAGLSLYAAYTKTSKDSNVVQGVGSGSIPLFTNGPQVDAWSATFSDTKAMRVGASYKFDKVSLATAHANFDKEGQKKVKETNFTITYKPTKNLTAQAQYSMLDNQYVGPEVNIDTDLRVRLIYSF